MPTWAGEFSFNSKKTSQLNRYSSKHLLLNRSLQSADLNKDGSEDLVMGAPVYSKLNKLQNGAVFIQLAQNQSGKLPFKTINLEEKADFILNPPDEAVSSRFGHAVTVLDLNQDGVNDIVVAAPSFGLQTITYQVNYLVKRFF
jgi:glycosylphosphatidylinositol phospholipase D